MAKKIPKDMIGRIERGKRVKKAVQKKPVGQPGQEKRIPLDDRALEKEVKKRINFSFPEGGVNDIGVNDIGVNDIGVNDIGPKNISYETFLEDEKEARKNAYPIDEIIGIRKALHGSREDIRDAIPQIKALIPKLRGNPQRFAEAVALLGKANYYLGDIDAALKRYEAAYRGDPENSEIAHDYGLLLLKASRYKEAIGPLDKYSKMAINVHEQREILSLLEAAKRLAN